MHTAPGHGREDFDIWTANARELEARGINSTIPYTVDENGALTAQAPGFEGKRVIDDKGNDFFAEVSQPTLQVGFRR